MLVYFGLASALGILAVDLTGLYGIPFTGYLGENGQRRNEAYRDLALLADLRKAELLRMINGRRAEAITFCNSPVMKRLVARTTFLLHTEMKDGKGTASLRSRLLRSEEGRLLAGHLSTIMEARGALYEKIDLADAVTGTVIASSSSEQVGVNVSDLPYFSEMRQGVEDENINELRDSRSGTTSLAILHNVRAGDDRQGNEGEVAAILVLYLRPDLFIKSLEAGGDIGRTGETFLVSTEKVLLTSLKRPLRDGTAPRPLETRIESPASTMAVEGNEGVVATEDYAGVPVLAAFRYLPLNSETALGMVVKQDQAEVFAPIRQLAVFMTLKALFFCLLALGLTYAIATRIARPIKELSRAARRVEEGDLGARAPVEGADEVGLLAESFNSMVQRIQHWHEELEEQVRSRTTDLVEINEALGCEIDERGRAEESLKASERRFRELLETVQMVAVILDPQGNITFCNDFLLRLSGWTREEVLGSNWFDTFIPEEVRENVNAVFSEALATSTVAAHFENPIVTKNGLRRVIIWDNTILKNIDGTLSGVASLGTDVTEQRNMEEQLRHSQKMEAVGQLAGGVAHDFNNLLTAIIGNCELIKMKIGPDTPVSDHLEQILSVSARAASLVHSLLAFSRKQFLKSANVDVNDCVKAVENLLVRVIGEDIDFRLALTETKLPVWADRDQLEQVLVNLATNARDAMPSGGELLIETRRVDLDQLSASAHALDKEGPYAVIQVSDTGSGMDEAVREKIFDPFFTTKEVGKGTGLGLAMAFGTISQHGGVIDVCSEVGSGTVFKIYLPVVHEAATGEGEAVPEEVWPRGEETVLVVEDNDDVRNVTTMILEAHGYRVIEAVNGEEAIVRFTESRDDVKLVLLDVIMPKMSGKEVYDAIRKIKPNVKALFTSGYTADILSKKVMLEDGLNFLQKPVPPLELLRKVRELLDRGHLPQNGEQAHRQAGT